MIHRIVVEDQSLRWYGHPPKIADDSIEFVRFQFHLPEDWDPLVLVAQFTQADTYNMLLDKDTCFLPKELTAGLCKLSLFGYAEGKPLRATSIPLVFQIEESGFVSSAETPIPPTPDLYAQLIEYFSSIAGSGGGGSGSGTINPEDIAAAVEEYLSNNPPEPGKDGFSPSAKVEQTAAGAVIVITDENGTTTVSITNGKDGKDGVSCTHSWNGTALSVTSASGTSSADLKGDKGDKGDPGAAGADGANGKDGYTPVKGKDYYTDADKTEMVNAVLAALPVWEGGSY